MVSNEDLLDLLQKKKREKEREDRECRCARIDIYASAERPAGRCVVQ